jgi:hypothetical protein
LLPIATDLERAGAEMAAALTGNALREIVAAVPDPWLETEGYSNDDRRRIYVEYLKRRLANAEIFLEEAVRARETLV